jgi:alpha-1,2-mannosyltransferase
VTGQPRSATWWNLGLAVLLIGAAVNVFIHQRNSYYLDLTIYHWGGVRLPDPGSLYDLAEPLSGMDFTYPPFAALLFWPLSHTFLLGSVAWTVGSFLALARMSWLMGRTAVEQLATDARAAMTRTNVACAALLLFGVMLLLEPATENLRLGQINFYLGWLILEGVLGRSRRWSGVLIGIAAAIKLTPAIFVLLLFVTGRVREAWIAVATFVTIGAACFLIIAPESRDFWGSAVFDASRTGSLEFASNQSIDGAVWRVFGAGGNQWLWVVFATLFVFAALTLARPYWRGGQRLMAVGLAALAACMASPVSWSHHWVIVLPLIAGLWLVPRRRWLGRAASLIGVAVLASRTVWHTPHGAGVEFHLTGIDALSVECYVVLGYVLLAVAFATRAHQAEPAWSSRVAGDDRLDAPLRNS